MHKRTFLTLLLGVAGGAVLSSLNLESAKANVLPASSDLGEIGQSEAILAQYGGDGEDRRRRRGGDDEERRRREEERRRQQRREEYDRCRRRFGEEICRLRFGGRD
jgi:hypothetical protein